MLRSEACFSTDCPLWATPLNPFRERAAGSQEKAGMTIALFICLLLLSSFRAAAQELFVYSEPASNMPAHSVGLRATNWLMSEQGTGRLNYHLIPEVMWGIGPRWMVHAEGFFSNRGGTLGAEGGGFYAKYRCYTSDSLYRHLRAAAFARVSVNNARIHQDEIAVNGHNSGYQLGGIGTLLLHRQALSATLYYEHAFDNAGGEAFPAAQPRDALNAVLSTGRLFYPRRYTGYGNLNVNGMVEMLVQQLPANGRFYIDIAPSVQFIINSDTRLDIGYRMELAGNEVRTAPNGFLVRIERLLFGVL